MIVIYSFLIRQCNLSEIKNFIYFYINVNGVRNLLGHTGGFSFYNSAIIFLFVIVAHFKK